MIKVDEIKFKVNGNKVVVYFKIYCLFCKKVKIVLVDVGLKDYVFIELDELFDGDVY